MNHSKFALSQKLGRINRNVNLAWDDLDPGRVSGSKNRKSTNRNDPVRGRGKKSVIKKKKSVIDDDHVAGRFTLVQQGCL